MKASGLFAFVRQRPYDIIADADVQPRAVFISAFDSNPLAPDFSFMLKGDEENFQTGLDALSKIAPVYLGLNVAQSSTPLAEVKNATVNVFDGPHPAGNVGVQINHIAPVNKGEDSVDRHPRGRSLSRTVMHHGKDRLYSSCRTDGLGSERAFVLPIEGRRSADDGIRRACQ
jgi:hypothetical protein